MIATTKNDQDARYSVVELCLALGVSRSGFYDHEQKPDGERRREDGVLAQKISLLFLEGRSADERPGVPVKDIADVTVWQAHTMYPANALVLSDKPDLATTTATSTNLWTGVA